MHKYLIMTVLIFLSFSLKLKAQNDSIIIEREVISENEDYFNKKYQYLNINLGDENKLLKLGVQPFKPSEIYSFTVLIVHLGYELKLNKSFTLINEVNSVNNWAKNNTASNILGYSIGTRYYFLKKSQIQANTSGNNCNGYYVLGGMQDVVGFISQKGTQSEMFYLERSFTYGLKPALGIGFQQKLTRHLYFDGNLSFNYYVTGNYITDKKMGFEMTFLFGGLLSFND